MNKEQRSVIDAIISNQHLNAKEIVLELTAIVIQYADDDELLKVFGSHIPERAEVFRRLISTLIEPYYPLALELTKLLLPYEDNSNKLTHMKNVAFFTQDEDDYIDVMEYAESKLSGDIKEADACKSLGDYLYASGDERYIGCYQKYLNIYDQLLTPIRLNIKTDEHVTGKSIKLGDMVLVGSRVFERVIDVRHKLEGSKGNLKLAEDHACLGYFLSLTPSKMKEAIKHYRIAYNISQGSDSEPYYKKLLNSLEKKVIGADKVYNNSSEVIGI
jgi:tetratricopeptide (TPR) repeat protein